MKQRLSSIAATLFVVLAAGAVYAQAPIYSFEVNNLAGPDGFFGLGATVTQDTIGATAGTKSMKYDVGAGGFVGARTETVVPASLNDPPGVLAVLFDMTLVNPFAGGFADIGVTVFGHALNAPGGAQFGHSVQFTDTEPIGGKAAGTYTNLQINLSQSAVGTYRPGESFNDIFGPGPTDLTQASAFQFFISKSAEPVTVYIDNVRLLIPEPASMAMAGVVGLALVAFRRRAGSIA